MSKRSKGLSVLAISMLLLAACGEKNSSTEKEKVTETPVAATTTEEDTTEDTNNKENNSASEQEATANSSSTTNENINSEVSEEKAAEKETTTSNKTATISAKKEEKTINPTIKKFIKNQLTLGQKGKIEGIPFTSGESLFEDITNKWGEPTTQFSNDTNYIEYAENGQVNYAFAVGRGDRIYDVRTFVSPSSSFKLADISLADIQTVAGKPSSITTSGTDQILNYTFGNNIVKFVGPSKTKKLHHISVFNQTASKTMGGNG